jgi:ribosome maturation factor RimP
LSPGDTKVPYFIIRFRAMTEKTKIENLVEEYINGRGLFMVAVRVSAAGKITVLVDRKEGITIEECAELSRFIEKSLDRNAEDYELQVSSPGLDMPFLVLQQYYKNEGRQVEVIGKDGEKYKGVLKNVTEGGFELETGVKAKPGSKNKPVELKDISFNYEQVKSAREIVTFK